MLHSSSRKSSTLRLLWPALHKTRQLRPYNNDCTAKNRIIFDAWFRFVFAESERMVFNCIFDRRNKATFLLTSTDYGLACSGQDCCCQFSIKTFSNLSKAYKIYAGFYQNLFHPRTRKRCVTSSPPYFDPTKDHINACINPIQMLINL